jgi:hypothetical protein
MTRMVNGEASSEEIMIKTRVAVKLCEAPQKRCADDRADLV